MHHLSCDHHSLLAKAKLMICSAEKMMLSIVVLVLYLSKAYGDYSRWILTTEPREVMDYECQISGVVPDWVSGTLVCIFNFTISKQKPLLLSRVQPKQVKKLKAGLLRFFYNNFT